MKKVMRVLLVLAGLLVVCAAITTLLTPWMNRWGATQAEIDAAFPGDELVPEPASVVNRAVTIQASPEHIYPWIVQLGAGKGGMYSYTWLETYLLNCPLVNADRIHPEWQDLKVGDQVKMCPEEPAPPPYTVALIEPDRAVVMGHQEDGKWVNLWQFVLEPQHDGSTRLILRTRTMMTGGFWTLIHPGVFIMERGMLLGIKERAEALAQESTPAAGRIEFPAIDRYITAQMKKHGLKGVSLAITQGEEIVYLKGYGTSGGGRPMTAQTPMYIGSHSKSLTGTAIAQLAEQGKIELNAPVQAYLPWFRVADTEASQKLTVNHLLHHTSGLSEAGFTTMIPKDASREEAVRALASARLTAPVGTKFQYFNMGYAVLAAILEAVSGQSYEAYMQEHIFTPLDMARTTTDPLAARENGLSQGYSRFFGFTIPRSQPHLGYQLSAGYIISTAEDLAHYAIAMNNDGTYEGTELLSREWVKRLNTPVQGYGMGWFIEPGHIFHGGANETFKTYVDLYPGEDLGIVLLINQGYMIDHYISAEQMFAGVSAIALGRQAPPTTQGISTRTIGWGLLGFVLALLALHTRNFLALRGWKARVWNLTPAKRAWDVAVHFLIPSIIFSVVFNLAKNFFGYRFNLTYQVTTMFTMLTDISILMLVGLLPDIILGTIKLSWLLEARRSQPGRIAQGETISP